MKQDLENYQPREPKYVLDDRVREEFPTELDFKAIPDKGLETKKDIMRFVGSKFTAVFPENDYVTREMDDFEKRSIREEYCQLVENILPQRKRDLEQALEEAKRMKKEAEELYASTLQEINAYAAEVKLGTTETKLKSSDTFCIALAGYYLTYTWNEERQVFVLAKGVEIADSNLWSNDDNNRAMMLECFGCEFPEPERKEEEEGDF